MPDRLTEKNWRNLDPWECCGQDDYCQRVCHDEGGCTNGCIVPKLYKKLAKYEDAEAEKRIYTAHDVSEVLAEFFGDPCACNFNGIDEWLPALCDFAEKSCPNPGGVACWEQYLKHKGKADVGARGE